ncbi:MAG TPA: DUF2877 domain-containing protein [Rectinemataceae bacterium]|nr:DUF2877 domain-containing protein [Rectinemataceae bacterium]
MPIAPATDRRLAALSIGPAAARALPGGDTTLRVHSSFANSVNIAVEGSELLVLLCHARGAGYPHSLVLPEESDFSTRPFRAGSTGLLRGGELLFGGPDHGVRIGLERARRRPRRMLPLPVPWSGVHARCAQHLARFQGQIGAELRIEALLDGTHSPGAEAAELHAAAHELALWLRSELAVSCSSSSPLGAQTGSFVPWKAVASLVGRGPGLTPSGDDFLCGWLAALRCGAGSADGAPAPGPAEALSRATAQSLDATTDISASLLRCAMQGFWPEPLADLAAALADEREFEAIRALDELCRFGHSSGADIATGFLFGLATQADRGGAAPCP